MSDFEEMLFGSHPEVKILGTVTGRIPSNHHQPPFALDLNAIKPAPPEFERPATRVVPPKGAGEANRISCVVCFRSWSGKTCCHCSACHETFSGVSLFDQHRREDGPHGYCLKTTAFKGMEFRDGMWRYPEMTAEEKAATWGPK